jgi:peptidoglycan biosynthesis protein MviN/MurJ (putative lipid II flippase)
VGILAVGVYLIFALTLLPHLSFLGLAFADGMKQMAHALMMIFLIYRWGGRLGHGVWRTALASTGASTIMGMALYFSAEIVMARLGVAGLFPRLMALAVPGVIGSALYYTILRWLNIPEIELLHRLLRRLIPTL